MKRGIQLAVVLTLMLALGWVLVRGTGQSQMDAWGKALGPVAFLENTQREGNFDGTVSARNVQLLMNRQQVLGSLYFDEWLLETPGLGYLLSTPFGPPERLPDRFKLVLTGVRGQPNSLIDHENRVWLNFKSWVPFDAYGCRESGEFIEADFAGMAMGRRRTTVTVDYDRDASGTKLNISWDNLDFPSVRLELGLIDFDLQQWLQDRFAVGDAALTSAQLTLAAGDYPKKRTQWCAKDRGITEAELLQTNEAMASAFLNVVGLSAEPRLLERWNGFNRDGGSIVMSAKYGRPLRLKELRGKKLAEVFDALRLRVKTDGAPDMPMRLTDFVLPVFNVAAAPAALDSELAEELEVAEAYNPLAEISSGRGIARRVSAQDQAKAAPLPQVEQAVALGPQPISFAQLQQEVGRLVIVVTIKGVRYRGKVLRASGNDVELQVMMNGGTAQLILKPSQVQRVLSLRRRSSG